MRRALLALAVAALIARSVRKARLAKIGELQRGNCFLAVGKWLDGGYLIIGHSESYYYIPHMAWAPELPEIKAVSLTPVDRKHGLPATFDSPLFHGRWTEETLGGARA